MSEQSNNEYLYELHCHTLPCSKCSRMTPEELVDALCEKHFRGAVITNHFYHGNTGIAREHSWQNFLAAYIEDYERAKAYGKTKGIDIFFGLEEGYGGGKEVLIYGLTPNDARKLPELRQMTLSDFTAAVHALGGLVFHAHPFRSRDYIREPDKEPDPTLIDGVEVYNAGDDAETNARALAFAMRHNLGMSSGGDVHTADRIGHAGIITERPLTDEKDLLSVLKGGKYRLIRMQFPYFRYCDRQ